MMQSNTPKGAIICTTKDVSETRKCLSQVIAVGVKNVLLLVYGLTMGMPTMLIPNLAGGVPGETIVLDENGISWIGSINYLSVPLGCIISGAVTRPIGRIRSLQAISLLFFGAFLLFHFASQAWHILVGLFFTGFSGGLLEAPTLIYTVEITEPHLRGALSSTSTLAIAIGLIISFVLGTIFPWRTMAIINGCIPLAGLLFLAFIPESPYWLISRNRLEEAKANLAWLRGWTSTENVEEEFEIICSELEKEEKKIHAIKNGKLFNLNSLKQYTKPTFVKPFLLICLTFVLAHFGTTQINIFAVKLFQVLKVPIDSYYATILIGTVELIGSILLMIFVRSLGKRILVFVTQLGIFLGFLLAGVYAYNIGAVNFESVISTDEELASRYNWVPLVSLTAVAFFSYLMTYTLPWILMGELFPNEIRDTASGLSAGTGYVIGFLSNKTFLNLVNIATLPGVFWLYSCVALIGIFLMYFLLPETEGKTLFEITEHYAGGTKLNNKVMRKDVKANVCNGIANTGFDGVELDFTKL